MSFLMRWLVSALLLFITLATGCDGSIWGEPEWQGRKTGAPAIWQVSGNGGKAWLFGSVHALPDGLNWSTPKLEQAIADSDRLVLEVVGLEDSVAVSKVFQEMGTSPNQPPLDQRLSPALAKRARDMGGPSDEKLATLENWAAALTFASLSTSKLPISSANGVERVLGKQYRDLEKPVIGLETVERQLSYFDQLSQADQRAMLESVVEDAQKAPAAFRALINSWLAGDLTALDQSTDEGLLSRPHIRAAVLIARNQDWTDQIDSMIQLGATPLVAVGAAHLAGNDSVITMLQARGYTVERLQ